ncbi:HAD hydrolase-like protein [Stappia sp. GBMRC 2046]|uniref:HAD hydrolase-like protein n=1 Tax=Stappia sediminis TaxID=2692190 RepID=A0A7X3LYH1_9HYPH|nr:HAD family hydrolase [Stappia sediminis]MXN67432.1 HAD hydrolase-like protein [Stappia sediminis]
MAARALVVFDLDDTLYLERDFAVSGFKAVGKWLLQERSINGFADVCIGLFDEGGRGNIFDRALERSGVAADARLVKSLVEIYRGHEPSISLAQDSERYLANRSRSEPLALITDGLAETQSAKVRALGLEGVIERIVYTGALGPGFGKPHPRAYELVEAWAAPFGLPLVYVADNPMKDFVTPRARGWLTVQIKRPERVHKVDAPSEDHCPHGVICNLDELDVRLEELMEIC